MADLSHLECNVTRFSGFAECYDAHRPAPPGVLRELLPRLAGGQRLRRVVDLGCGTGLSTLFWAHHCEAVVGVEPNADMRAQAERRAAGLPQVRFVSAWSHATGLPGGEADLVTCSQSLHWMEPEQTFAEVARLLRPGGLFAAYDCDWPPTFHWEVEAAYRETMQRVEALGGARNAYAGVRRWEKSGHLERMRASERFRYVREVLVHAWDEGDAERLLGLCRSMGSVATLLKLGLGERELGLASLQAVAQRALGSERVPWLWSYRVRLGVR